MWNILLEREAVVTKNMHTLKVKSDGSDGSKVVSTDGSSFNMELWIFYF
jgi:hypothetical protein